MPSAVPNGTWIRSSTEMTIVRMRAHDRNCSSPIPAIKPGSESASRTKKIKAPIPPSMGTEMCASPEYSVAPIKPAMPPKSNNTPNASNIPREPKTMCRMPSILTCCSMAAAYCRRMPRPLATAAVRVLEDPRRQCAGRRSAPLLGWLNSHAQTYIDIPGPLCRRCGAGSSRACLALRRLGRLAQLRRRGDARHLRRRAEERREVLLALRRLSRHLRLRRRHGAACLVAPVISPPQHYFLPEECLAGFHRSPTAAIQSPGDLPRHRQPRDDFPAAARRLSQAV